MIVSRPVRTALLTFAGCLLSIADAGGLTLRNGFSLTGEPIKRTAISIDQARARQGVQNTIYPLMTVEDGVRRYFFPYRMMDRDTVDNSADIGLQEFVFEQPPPLSNKEPSDIGAIDQSGPFQTRGGREIEIASDRGNIKIIQAAEVVRPDYIGIVSRNLLWEYGLLTTELPDESLLTLLDAATNPAVLQDMLARVSFLVQANRLSLARAEMQRLKDSFPGANDRAEAFGTKLEEFYGVKALSEVRRRRAAGQHETVMRLARTLRDNEGRVSSDVADSADEILFEYEELLEKRDNVVFHLGELEGLLESSDADRVRPLRSKLLDELHADTIGRLDSFLKSVDDQSLQPAEKLALAYSAWVAGPDSATTDIQDAADYWTMRAAVIDYVRSENRYVRDSRWPAINAIEGVDIVKLEAMIPLLPAIHPLPTAEPSQRYDVTTESGVSYTVQLPQEYSSSRLYPVLVVLHSHGMTPAQELDWWAGTPNEPGYGQNRGYIVASVDYLGDEAQPSGNTHDRIVDVLIALRRQFRVDSNRTYLAGHGLGADVAWDLGLARPLCWSGLIPIGGRCSPSVKAAYENGAYVPVYAVNGSLDGRTFSTNAATIQRMMEARHDIILCEYMNRGRESYAAERPRIFDWIDLQNRGQLPRDIDANVFHETDTRWIWYQASPRSGLVPPQPGQRPPGQRLMANIRLGNTIYLASQPAKLLLRPGLVDYENRVRLKYGSQHLKTRLLEPSMKTMLDDFAERFDRQKLFWTEVSVP